MMQEFLLVFRRETGGDEPRPAPEQLQAMMKPWQDWIGGIAAQNKLVSAGNRLASDGLVVQPNEVITNLCLEAMRLTLMLIDNEPTNTPATNALLALMCFHASRFEARTDPNGDLILYEDQDEALWNRALIEKGEFYLNRASQGKQLSKYYLERPSPTGTHTKPIVSKNGRISCNSITACCKWNTRQSRP